MEELVAYADGADVCAGADAIPVLWLSGVRLQWIRLTCEWVSRQPRLLVAAARRAVSSEQQQSARASIKVQDSLPADGWWVVA